MKTIRQIADEIGVSKQAVQKRISREPLYTRIQPYIDTKQGTKYIDEDGEKLIKQAFLGDTPATPSIDKTDNQLSGEVAALVAMLQEELKLKNDQIREQQQTITQLAASNQDMAAALQGAQALHAGTMQKQLAAPDPGEKKRGLFGLFRKKATEE